MALTSEDARAYVLLMFGSLGLLRSEEDAGAYRAKLASVDAETAAAEGFCSVDRAWHFLARVEGGYRDNAYHNFRHAVDVTHTVYRYIVLTEPRTHVTPVEKFSLMIAALSHDLDHPGVNNAFLVNTKDALATVYNDSSVLENSHIARLYNLIDTRQTRQARAQARRRDRERLKRANGHHEHDDDDDDASGAEEEHPDEANVFELLDDELYREVRKMIIACVLHTDMSHHFKMVSQMEVFYEVHSEGIRANTRRVNRGITVECIYVEPEDRLFVLQVMLHAADISNPVKPLATYGKWAENVLREFFAQGDQERALGMDVSPMMDAAATNAAMSQINFIEFVVAPLYASFVRLFPETSRLVAHLVANRMHYQAVLERELEGTGCPMEGTHPSRTPRSACAPAPGKPRRSDARKKPPRAPGSEPSSTSTSSYEPARETSCSHLRRFVSSYRKTKRRARPRRSPPLSTSSTTTRGAQRRSATKGRTSPRRRRGEAFSAAPRRVCGISSRTVDGARPRMEDASRRRDASREARDKARWGRGKGYTMLLLTRAIFRRGLMRATRESVRASGTVSASRRRGSVECSTQLFCEKV